MNRLLIFLTIGLGFLLAACDQDENFVIDGSIQLQFSVDTLTFDTVFTAVGSATRALKIYNPSNRPLKIGKVYF